MTARAAVEQLAAEVARLNELVLDQGQAIADLVTRLRLHEDMLAADGRELMRRGREAAKAGPERERSPYERAAAFQARRRAMHAVPATGEVAR